MGLGSIAQEIATTVMMFKADVTDLKAKIRDLQGAEKDAAQAAVRNAEARNKGFETISKGITQVNAAVAAVGTALEYANVALDHNRLKAATAAVDLEKLRAASRGLQGETQLLSLAQAGLSGALKLNENQIIIATKAIDGFRAMGFETAKSSEVVRQAILKGNVEPLKELGINVDVAKTKSEQFSQVMEILGDVSKKAGTNIDAASEAAQRQAVRWEDAMHKIQVGIGNLVIALGPFIDSLSRTAAGIGQVADKASKLVGKATGDDSSLGDLASKADPVQSWVDTTSDILDFVTPGDDYTGVLDNSARNAQAWMRMTQAQAETARSRALAGQRTTVQLPQAMQDAMREWRYGDRYDFSGNYPDSVTKPKKPKRGGGGGAAREPDAPAYFVDVNGIPTPVYAFQAGSWGEYSGGLGSAVGDRGDLAAPGALTGAQAASNFLAPGEGLAERYALLAQQVEAEAKGNIISRLFGPSEEVAKYTETLETLRGVVDVLSGSLQNIYDVWASGEKSLGQAIKEGSKAALQGIGSMMWGRAIEHGADAIGELARGFTAAANPLTAKDAPIHFAAAATHGKAALVYAAGAALLGVASRGANAGAGAGAGASAGAPSAGYGGATAAVDRGPTSIMIINDSSSGRRSARWRARDTLEEIQYAERYAGSGGNVVAYR